jgi:uncharacterized membrane protein
VHPIEPNFVKAIKNEGLLQLHIIECRKSVLIFFSIAENMVESIMGMAHDIHHHNKGLIVIT